MKSKGWKSKEVISHRDIKHCKENTANQSIIIQRYPSSKEKIST